MGMTRDRFEEVAEAYGGDVARWPAEAREDAAVLMAEAPAWAREVLDRARAFDATLDAWRAPLPSGALAERIAAGAPAPRPSWIRWMSPAALAAGLAAACAAGVVLGAQLSGRLADRVAAHQAEQTAAANASSDAASDLEEGA